MLKHAALHDPLTNLANRNMFQDRLSEALKRTKRSGIGAGVILIDLDYFKQINDTKGHDIGDQLLVAVSNRLLDSVRDTDTVARLGGDEFAIIQSDITEAESARIVLERIHSNISKPYELGKVRLDCGFSMGIALAPNDGVDAEELLRKADLALYQAKEDGRGIFHFYDERVESKILKLRQMENDLRGALENNELELYYQPIIDSQSDQICVMEALLRWHHPKHGLISPGEFIPVAEKTHLIIPMGEWVLQQACKDATFWPDHIRVAINVSAVQFGHPSKLLKAVTKALQQSQLSPHRLELEITENVLLHESDLVLEALESLQSQGIRIVLDDFGTGYSSLSYLRSFPFNKLKLDRTFVHGLSQSEASQAILRVVASLGKSFGMDTTAEGVENEWQLERVQLEGFSQVQGFLYGQPVPAPEALKLFEQSDSQLAA